MIRSPKTLFVAVFVMLMQSFVHGVTIYSDQASFLSAAGQMQSEDFENAPLSGSENSGAASSLSFNFLTASSTPPSVKVLNVALPNGNHNTTPGGNRYLTFDTDQGSVSADAVLTFSSPVSAMGLFLIDIEEGVFLNINRMDYLVPSTVSGGEAFFGVVSEASFTTVSLDAGVNDSQWSIDDISVRPVPEPNASVLIAFGMVILLLKRQNPNPTPIRFGALPINTYHSLSVGSLG